MSYTKKPKKLVTKEELTRDRVPGITGDIYTIQVFVPNDWIDNPVEGIGISSAFIHEPTLKSMTMYAGSLSIDKVNKTNVLVRFNVINAYFDLFYGAFLNLPDTTEVKILLDPKRNEE